MDKKKAIDFLKTKLGEIQSFERLPHNNQEYPVWFKVIEGILEEVFGRDSSEYIDFTKREPLYGVNITERDVYLNNLMRRKTVVQAIIQKYEILEKESQSLKRRLNRRERELVAQLPLSLYDELHFHPKVVEASRKLFSDGHYRDAIYRAFVEVNNSVREKSGLPPHELRGMKESQIMAKVFDVNNPIIKLNELINDTDISEQEGFKFLFMGATIGIRNPKAHENIIQKDPFRTLEYLALASILMRRVEEGTL